jgi:hypothetical protein
MDKMERGYKSASIIYDRYNTSGNLFFKIVAKIVWGFDDKEYSVKLLEGIPDGFPEPCWIYLWEPGY